MKVRLLLATRASARLRRVLAQRDDVVVRTARADGDVWKNVLEEDLDLLLLDRAHLDGGAAERVGEVRDLPGGPEVVVLARAEDAVERASLLAAGCLGVLVADVPDEALREGLGALVDRRRASLLERFRIAPGLVENRLSDFASASPAMQSLMRTAGRVVESSTSLLLLGETGVGKEWLARAIHHEGPRSRAPFVAVNCAAMPETLLETELFGHERGAFTGAVRARRGHFEVADQGTLFLDEIAEMPVHLQAKLLRAVQERTIQRVGGEQPLGVDVRIMAATHREPAAEIAAGRLREDLYYRLAVMTLRVPPLRERREDLPALVATYVDRFARGMRSGVRGLTPDTMEALLAYRWPGNLRELINVLERATLLASGAEITRADLPEEIRRGAVAPATSGAASVGAAPRDAYTYAEARRRVLDEFERGYVSALLRSAGGRVGEAAARAALNPRTLHELMRRHGLRKEDYKFTRRAVEPSAP